MGWLKDILEENRRTVESWPVWKRGGMQMREKCRWEQDSDGAWQTACGHAFWINDGPPSENDMQYCTYCGRGLTESPYVEE
mgnify:CR=1 FL=1